jgi:hypothetical protein
LQRYKTIIPKFWQYLTLVTTLLLAVCCPADAACLDVSTLQSGSFDGVVEFHIYPGAPGFRDVQAGDTPEPTYVLRLFNAICIRGDEFANPAMAFSTVQLITDSVMGQRLRGKIGRKVMLRFTDPFAAHTGHHHAPLLVRVTEVREKSSDPTDEYGTGAMVVRAFYLALGQGSGDLAASYIVPENRKGNFDPEAMTRFYSSMREPLRLDDVASVDGDRFDVRYTFRKSDAICRGRSVVQTEKRAGKFFIRSIRALSKC